jgi:hypothetical protein
LGKWQSLKTALLGEILHCRLPIADFRFETQSEIQQCRNTSNRQSTIENRQSKNFAATDSVRRAREA